MSKIYISVLIVNIKMILVLRMLSIHVISQGLSVCTKKLTNLAGEARRDDVSILHVHLNVSFNFGSVTTFTAVPAAVRLLHDHPLNPKVKICES